MEDNAWTVKAVSLYRRFQILLVIPAPFFGLLRFNYRRSDEPSASWKDPSASLKLKIFCKIPFQLTSSFSRFFLAYWSWWNRSSTLTRVDGSKDPDGLHTSSRLDAIPPGKYQSISFDSFQSLNKLDTFNCYLGPFFHNVAGRFGYIQYPCGLINSSIGAPYSEETLETPAGWKSNVAERSIPELERNRCQWADTNMRSFAER